MILGGISLHEKGFLKESLLLQYYTTAYETFWKSSLIVSIALILGIVAFPILAVWLPWLRISKTPQSWIVIYQQ